MGIAGRRLSSRLLENPWLLLGIFAMLINDMTELQEFMDKIVAFRDERDWKQFHTPKDLAISLMLEAAEVAEHFQWKNAEEIAAYATTKRDALGDELADVLSYLLLISNEFGIDLAEAFRRKTAKAAEKYPVEKAKGRHTKYTEL